jgi:tetratricopeptide (TPR) repeat protein
LFNSGPSLKGPFRSDLPVFYVTDDQLSYSADLFTPIWNEVQKSKAPWTLRFGAGMPIFFEAFEDSDEARKIIRESLYFFKNHLESLPTKTQNSFDDREMIATLYRADYARAAIELKQWLSNHPDDQYALNKYAMISFMQKNYIEAEQAYRKVKDLHPVYRIDLVKALLANNKEAEATRELTLAMRSGKVKRSPYPGIATFLYSLGRYGQGVSYYEMASEHDLKGEDFYNMARGYARTNEIDKALRALEKSINLKFPSSQQIENDTDLYPLRSDGRYRQLINRIP